MKASHSQNMLSVGPRTSCRQPALVTCRSWQAWLLLQLLASFLPHAISQPITFKRVPTVKDVPPQDLARLQRCLTNCAVNTNDLVTAFDANLTGCTFETGAASGCLIRKSCFTPCFNQFPSGVYENRYNPERTGFVVDPDLPLSKVTKGSFGRLRYWTVDGAVYAQPLYVPDLVVNGTIVNLVYAATEQASVYAFNSESGDLIWRKNFLGDSPIYPTDFSPPCYDIAPEWGVTSTPYINRDSNTLYVVPWTEEGGKFVYRIHALNLITGAENLGGPSPPISATKTFQDGSTATFDAKQQVQRPGLSVYNGWLYVAFGSRCDASVYYAWVMAFNATTLQPMEVLSMPYTKPGKGPGIWQGGAGPVFFNGNMFLVTGDGELDASRGSYGDCVIRVSLPDLNVVDYFSPSNQEDLQDNDLDMGSSAAIPVKGKYLFTGGKEGAYYLLKADALGGYNKDNNNGNAWQTIPAAAAGNIYVSVGAGGIYSGAAYWPQGNGQLYLHGVRAGVPLRKFAFGAGDKLTLAASSAVVGNFTKRASVPIVSAVSTDASEAIVWEVDSNDTLYAWNATDLAPLWNSTAADDRADCKNWVKFATPTVAGGKVFIGCGSKLVAYGPR